MFTELVTSTDLIGVIGDAAWEELPAWHDRVLRATFGENGGEEVRHTGDGFFCGFRGRPGGG
jgi:class 3 adenylate cyclase